MSHFNLNNGMPRKRYIGPTHGLPSRPGTASLENLGGRIIIENEMHNHKLRLKQIKPSIDSGKPWAHDYQDTRLRRSSPSRADRPDGGSPNATTLPPASRSGGLASGSSSTAYRSGSAMGNSRGAAYGSKSAGSPASSPSATKSFDVTSLSSDNQNVYKNLVQMLSTLPQRESKALLEQAYREGEERKLLMAYTGSFPDANNVSSSVSKKRPTSSTPVAAAASPSSKKTTSAADHNRSTASSHAGDASTAMASSAASVSSARPRTDKSAASSTSTTPRRPASSKAAQNRSGPVSEEGTRAGKGDYDDREDSFEREED